MTAALLAVTSAPVRSYGEPPAEAVIEGQEKAPENNGYELVTQEEVEKALAEGDMVFTPSSSGEEERAGVSMEKNVVRTALGQVGVSGRPNKYTYWLGSIAGTYAYAWCHAFASWCGVQAGAANQVPITAGCYEGVQWFKNRGLFHYRSSGYIPKAGDYIYFDWYGNGTYDHVGIVNYVKGGKVYTIEGNAGDRVRSDRSYLLSDYEIMGYGSPAYDSTADSVKPKISDIKVTDVTKDGYTVSCKVSDNRGISLVKFPTRHESMGESSNRWLIGSVCDGVAAVRVNVSDFGYREGNYITEIYAYDYNNNYVTGAVNAYVDRSAPVISDVTVKYLDSTGYTVCCTVTDNQGISYVQFPTWTLKNGQDDLAPAWQTNTAVRGIKNGNTYVFRVDIQEHNRESGDYQTHIYAYDEAGNYSGYGNLEAVRVREHAAGDGLTERCGHALTLVRFKKSATYKKTGYTGDTFCRECGRKIAVGQVIPRTAAESGTVITDPVTHAVYRVLTSKKNNRTVQYVRPCQAGQTVVIPKRVKLYDYVYKVTEVGRKAFCKNRKIRKITIGANVKNIGRRAFYGCKNLKRIVIKTKLLKTGGLEAQVFSAVYKKAVIKVPGSRLKAYRNLLKKNGIPGKVIIKK